MKDHRSEKPGDHLTIGNVTYLWGKKDRKQKETGVEDLASREEFSQPEQTMLDRLRSSVSSSMTPDRIRAKIAGMGFTGEKAEKVYDYITASTSYDVLWSATREVSRRLQRGKGEQRLIQELRAAGFDEGSIEQTIRAVTDDDWIRALDIAVQSASIRNKEGQALQQALLRRGFSIARVKSFLKQREEEKDHERGSDEPGSI